MPVEAEADENQHTDEAKGDGNEEAKSPGCALSLHGGRESPFAKEIPDADSEMERGGENADGGEEEEIRIGEKLRDFGVSGFAVSEPALGVEMPADIKEGDEAGVALGGVKPVPYPGVGGDVGLAAYPYIDAVTGVVEHGQEDESPFDERAERDGLKVAGNFVIFCCGDEGGAVGPEMFGEERANGNDSGKRMKFS